MKLSEVKDIELLKKLIEELIMEVDVGIYPKSVIGGKSPYEKRNDYQNGWNNSAIEYYNELVKVLRKYDISIED
jgi:hypothetical protein